MGGADALTGCRRTALPLRWGGWRSSLALPLAVAAALAVVGIAPSGPTLDGEPVTAFVLAGVSRAAPPDASGCAWRSWRRPGVGRH